jgi:hypothetical protein
MAEPAFRETTLADIPDYSHLNYVPTEGRYELFAVVGYPINAAGTTAGNAPPSAVYSIFDRAEGREVRRWSAMSLRQAEVKRGALVELVKTKNHLDRVLTERDA